MKVDGFTHDAKQIYHMESKGKDISFDRWRIALYYEPNYASTVFFGSQPAYDAFITRHIGECYPDYSDFVADWRYGHD